MATTIEWSDETWNAVTGCTEVSPGCDHCYARELAHRRLRDVYTRQLPVVDTAESREDPFAVRLWPDRLDQPRRWRKPRMVFVNSMSDFFHAEIPEDFQRRMFAVMLEESRHTYQILTKRPGRAIRFFRENPDLLAGADLFTSGEVPPHIWIGVSVESQDFHYRVDQLRKVPAAVRFLSCEPLLGPLDLDLEGVHWVIVGGESGADYRAMDEEWPVGIRDQCLEAGVPFFFKQWGGRTPKAGGRILEGRKWSEFPEVSNATR